MTMPYSPSRAVYEGNDAATRFPFSFKVWDASQLVVTLTSPDGATTEASGWTADIGASGGEIVYLHEAAPLPSGWKLAVTRNMPFTQEVNLVSASRFDPQVIEDALDQATAERQQVKEMLGRAVILPSTSDETPQDVVRAVYASRDAAAASAANSENASHEATIQASRSEAEADRAKAEANRSKTEANRAESAAEVAADDARAAVASELARAVSEADKAKAEADRAQSLANVGPATSDKLGMVKIGEGIAVEEDGTISVPPPPEINLATNATAGTVIVGAGLDITGLVEEGQDSPAPGTLSLAAHSDESGAKYGRGDSQFFGHVKLTDDFEQDADATSGISISPKGVKTAFDRVVGILGEQIITSSRTWVVPETGRYSITAVGGGGNGGSGGGGARSSWEQWEMTNWGHASGGGGGGGGSGERTTTTVQLTKGASYSLTIGGAGGTTSFGALLTARGGGHGSPGGSGYVVYSELGYYTPYAGGGGGAGSSYGGGAGNGGGGQTFTGQYNAPVYGGGGGYGGTSVDGYYGNGGAGGAGGGVSGGSVYGAAGGAAGRQGCIKIKIVPV
ncbi:hypothetical protein [Desulfovibrio sp.]|uniref:hypothetical protein n=1 Tax=Desulfovibrio sp. TaxID=885 RepID=UPI003D0CD883